MPKATMQVEGVGAQPVHAVVYRLHGPQELSSFTQTSLHAMLPQHILDNPLGHLAPPNVLLPPNAPMKGSTAHEKDEKRGC